MLAGPAITQVFAGGGGVPAVMPPVFPHRADPDADSTGGDVPPGEVGAVGSAGRLVGEALRVVPAIERAHGAGFDTEHAPGAEVPGKQRVGRKVRGGEDRAKPDPWAVLRGEEGVVDAEGPEPGEEGSVAVREEGDRILLEHLDRPVAVAGDEDRGVALVVEKRGEPVGVLVEQGVDGLIQLVIVDRGGGREHREVDRETDDEHRPGLREDRLRVELFRHPGLKWRVLPAVGARDPDERDLHPPAAEKDGCLQVVGHDNGSFQVRPEKSSGFCRRAVRGASGHPTGCPGT